MAFKNQNMECEILTKFKPSLVCTVKNNDIIVGTRNTINFTGMSGQLKDRYTAEKEHADAVIGAELDRTYKNINLGRSGIEKDKDEKEYDMQLDIVSGLREGDWANRTRWGGRDDGDDEKGLILAKYGIKHKKKDYYHHNYEEIPAVTTLILNRKNKDKFVGGSICVTKSLLASDRNLHPDIVNLIDNLIKKGVGPEVGNDNIKHKGVKMNWWRHSSGGYGGHEQQQVELIVEDGSFLSIKDKALFALRESNVFHWEKDAEGKNIAKHHVTIAYDKTRIQI